jgi:hypothetical protein
MMNNETEKEFQKVIDTEQERQEKADSLVELISAHDEEQYKKYIHNYLKKAKTESERDSILSSINYEIRMIPEEYVTLEIACRSILKSKLNLEYIPEKVQCNQEFISFFIENFDRIITGSSYGLQRGTFLTNGLKLAAKSDAIRLFLELY